MKNSPDLHLSISLSEHHWEWLSPVLLKMLHLHNIRYLRKCIMGIILNTQTNIMCIKYIRDWCHLVTSPYAKCTSRASHPPFRMEFPEFFGMQFHGIFFGMEFSGISFWNGIPWNLLKLCPSFLFPIYCIGTNLMKWKYKNEIWGNNYKRRDEKTCRVKVREQR